MIPLFCGVDAGGTSCRAVVMSSDGRLHGWGYATGANPNHAGWEGADASIREAVHSACANAGTKSEQISSIFLGMASVISAEDRAQASGLCKKWNLAPDCRCNADHDIRIALQGGLSGRPGIALIAGTGSSCYGRNAKGDFWQSGGWDRLVDDLGSGYDLAQKGMAAACQSADGRIEASLLQAAFFSEFGVDNVIDFTIRVHRPGLARHEIAALTPLVLQAAQQNDPAAVQIVVDGANELARMVEAVAKRLFPERNPEIVMAGGLLEKSVDYRGYIEKAVHARLPKARFCTAELRPAIGALVIAAEQAQSPFNVEQLQKLSSQAKE